MIDSDYTLSMCAAKIGSNKCSFMPPHAADLRQELNRTVTCAKGPCITVRSILNDYFVFPLAGVYIIYRNTKKSSSVESKISILE